MCGGGGAAFLSIGAQNTDSQPEGRIQVFPQLGVCWWTNPAMCDCTPVLFWEAIGATAVTTNTPLYTRYSIPSCRGLPTDIFGAECWYIMAMGSQSSI